MTREPRLVLFRGITPAAGGPGHWVMGQLYCPGGQTVVIDPAFYDTLRSRPG